MGHDEIAKREKALAVMDSIIGEVKRFNIYRACPKCGADSDVFLKRWCPGGDTSGAARGPCKAFGQHLHGLCQKCQFQWREETADADLERERLAAELSRKE